MDEPRRHVPRAIRATTWLIFAVQVVVAAGGLIGGPIRIVVGLSEGDGGQLAAGGVGLLLGGAFAAMAYARWTETQSRSPEAEGGEAPRTIP